MLRPGLLDAQQRAQPDSCACRACWNGVRLELIIINGEVVNVVFRKLGHKRMLPPVKQREAEAFVRAKAADIARKWNEYFVLHQHVAPERINKRIKR